MQEIKHKENSSTVRLQKYIADCGVCSRRKAETFIESGSVVVNGKIAQIGQKVIPGKDQVFVNKKPIHHITTISTTLLLNKPKNFICTNDDPFAEKTVFDLLPKQFAKHRLFSAGRLDKDSEGMLILTNDGALAHRITHPSSQIVKRYQVKLNSSFDTKIIPKLLKGLRSEGELLKADKVLISNLRASEIFDIEVHLMQGRKREIRRMLELFGYQVKKLKRFQIGSLKMKGMPLGSVRELSEKEISLLFA